MHVPTEQVALIGESEDEREEEALDWGIVQAHVGSTWQEEVQQSPPQVLPSSQLSPDAASSSPLPQTPTHS